ncbi:hypothetical protein FRX31_012935, partial [Thalictrum thalictroides]
FAFIRKRPFPFLLPSIRSETTFRRKTNTKRTKKLVSLIRIIDLFPISSKFSFFLIQLSKIIIIRCDR